jgi:phospholipid/cholesterol/gamma-HCH transport system substrate-binding protein
MTMRGLGGAVTGALGLVAASATVLAVALTAPVGAEHGDRYRVTGLFDNVGGLVSGAPVTVGGVRIGEVSGLEYDFERQVAVATLSIDSRHSRIPADSGASVLSAGLLGERYVELEPGGADERFLREGDQIVLTNSAFILEQVVARMMFESSSPAGAF